VSRAGLARMAAAAALVALLAVPSAAPATACDETSRPTVSLTNAPPVRGLLQYDCKELHVTGTLTVASGGQLRLEHVRLVVDGPAGAVLDVQPGGTLWANATDFAASGPAYVLRIGSGAHALLVGGSITGQSTFELGASDARVDGTLVSGAREGWGIVIPSGSPRVANVDIVSAVTAIQVGGTASPTLTKVSTEASYAALRAKPGTRVAAEGCTLQADVTGVLLEGNAQARLANSTVAAPTQADLAAGDGGAPRLQADSTPLDLAKVTLAKGARLEVGWYARAKAVREAGVAATPAPRLAVRDGNGLQTADLPFGAGDLAPPFLAPVAVYNGTGATTAPTRLVDRNPYLLSAAQGTAAGAVSLSFAADRAASPVEVPLPLDDDRDPPAWTDAAHTLAIQSAAAGVSDGTATLSWAAADDTHDAAGAVHPQRRAAYYEVLDVAAKATLLRTTATTLQVSGLAEGNHTFTVRAIDLVGLKGVPSNKAKLLVDRSQAGILVTGSPRPSETSGTTWWFNDTFDLSATNTTSPPSGLGGMQSRIGTAAFAPYVAGTKIHFADEGNVTVAFRTTTNTGAVGTVERFYILDRQDPTLDVQTDPAGPDGRQGWFTRPVRLVVAAEDLGPAGLGGVRVQDGAGAWTAFNATTPLAADGDRLVAVQAYDHAGNRATTQLHLKTDLKAPTLNLSIVGPAGTGGWFTGGVRVYVNATDTASGVDQLLYRLNDGLWSPFRSPLALNGSASWRLSLQARDVAGNTAAPLQQVVPLDGDAPIPPVAFWEPQPGGAVRVSWPDAPPLDLGSGVATVAVQRQAPDGSVAQTLPLQTGPAAQSVDSLPAGSQRLRVLVTDQAGNQAATPWTPVQVAPGGGLAGTPASKRGIETLTFDAPAGFQTARLDLYVDGLLRWTQTEAPFEVRWDSREVADGRHALKLVGVDRLGTESATTMLVDVHNGYLASVADGALPFTAAAGLGTAALATSATGFVLHRRWVRR
jgi:hypothetical protein